VRETTFCKSFEKIREALWILQRVIFLKKRPAAMGKIKT